MNDYVMTKLSQDHRSQLHAEASRERLARDRRRPRPEGRPTADRRGIRTHIALLLGRTPA